MTRAWWQHDWVLIGLVGALMAAMMLPVARQQALAQVMTVSPLAVGRVDDPTTLFVRANEAAGLDITRRGRLSDMVVGQAWGDYNNDGWLDLYITDTRGPNTLYENRGDGTFAVSAWQGQVALGEAFSGGATFADYDNDGWQDLYVVNFGSNVLFRNDGGHGFVDVTAEARVGDVGNGKTAAWGDFDEDGWLDLYVANWACSPACGRATVGDKDRLFRNNGDGTFSDVSDWLGRDILFGAGFVASFVDYDNDGDLDIYLVNDEFINPIGNVLWRNDGRGCAGWCFTIVSDETNSDTQVMGMGLATGDFNNDGRMDFFFSNAGPMQLLEAQDDGTFENMSFVAGVDARAMIGWGAVNFDANQDGWQDIYLAVASRMNMDPAGNPLYMNNRNGTYSVVGPQSGAYDLGRTVGLALGDYDNDGLVDLLVGNADVGHVLYRNQGTWAGDNGRLVVAVTGGGPVNLNGIGTRVYVTTADGLRQFQEVKQGSSLGSGETLVLFFGLGETPVTDVRVVWPNGLGYSLGGVAHNSRIDAIYPQGAGVQRALIIVPGGVWGWLPAGVVLLLMVGVMVGRRKS